MRDLKKITFLLGEFSLQSPAQQILDRFLLGYPRDGGWRTFPGTKCFVAASRSIGDAELTRRVRDHGVTRITDELGHFATSDAVIIIPTTPGAKHGPELPVRTASAIRARVGTCFIYGPLADDFESARLSGRSAAASRTSLLSGTWVPVAPRLPQVDVPPGAPLKEALVVVQGPKPAAELHGLDLALALVERRRGGEAGIDTVRTFAGEDVWRDSERRAWSWPLLAAALSRSNSPQGDALKDARTQDLAGLGLVPKLAREPRGVSIFHKDGLRTTVLVLDGVVADINFAVQLRSGEILSAQVLRGPSPAENHYSRLVAAMDDFFRTGKPPWPASRGVLLSDLVARLMAG
ncbi:MAG: hypothetical protein FJ386_06265 [Verrucomicrobia bacterium]|nr:hypothetical protein [Verrucomicrobiota bacterium]